MKLIAVSYAEHTNDPRKWELDRLDLGDVNLLVGKNAIGKTRVLNVIAALSNVLSGGLRNINNAHWNTDFSDDNNSFKYELKVSNKEVISENFSRFSGRREKKFLKRGKGGTGKLWAEKSRRNLDFQLPQDQIAALARQDKIQHSYFIPLVEWGKGTFHF